MKRSVFIHPTILTAMLFLSMLACNSDETCEPCFELTEFGTATTVCESDLSSPQAFQDSLAVAKIKEANSLGGITVEEKEECN
jgi:hypothetical protein